jgi:hemin uptake protein HemP
MKSMKMRRELHSYVAGAETRQATTPPAVAAVNSGVLFAGSSEVIIAHGPEVYRLRQTRLGKLILTK